MRQDNSVVPTPSKTASCLRDNPFASQMMHLLRETISSYTQDRKVAMENQKLIRRIGKRGRGRCQFNNPCGICVTKSGDIVIADTDNHRIQIFTSEGIFKSNFGTRGCKVDQINFPMCVAMTTDGHVALTDSVNACVKIFSLQGQLVQMIGDNEIFDIPYGLDISKDGDLAVTDICKHCVTVFRKDGSVIHGFGEYGSDHYEFDYPYFVCFDKDKHIIVSDSGNSCIKIFSFEGRGLRTFKQNDFKLMNESFVTLQGMCVDADGNILVICNSTVYLLARNGRLWEVLTSKDGLTNPRCLAFAAPGRLVLTNYDTDKKHEICIYKYHYDDYKSVNSVQFYAINV
ncbi:tripartite motif-containing protein 3-like isoform X1 [Pecten maximus]|uniref:tripartite motif-containing protein 3-like isoform X1 n=2 Tax=Pecten maximus TaxID=6579 RepID=UPI001458479E|nr:tripartite motif-containing protein 3-like isoform X1 [Pecten maximus]